MARPIMDPARVARAVLEEAQRRRTAVVGEVESVPPLPFVPSEAVKAVWEGFWYGASRHLVDLRGDLGAIYSWIRLVQSAEMLRDDYDRNPVYEDIKGRFYENPVAKRLAHIEHQIRAFEDRFGLSPAARRVLAAASLASSVDDEPDTHDLRGFLATPNKQLPAAAPSFGEIDMSNLLQEDEVFE